MQSRALCKLFGSTSAVKMTTYAFLFPGQGSQYVGMTQKLSNQPAVDSVFRTAEHVLGYDLQTLCLSGPQLRLDETVHCQPAVMAASLAALETLKRDKPEILECCRATAGFSVGEITALTFAEALTLETGLQFIHARAAVMQEACMQRAGTMLTVIGLPEAALERICREACTNGTGGEVGIANYIFPRGYVISGSLEAVERVGAKAEEAGASVKRLAVSGAFHSPLMEPAAEKLRSVLDRVQINFPKIPVYSNVTGRPYSSVGEIRDGLALQVTRPVQWETVVRSIARDTAGVHFMEIGPGKQLKAMLRRIDKEAFKHCLNIEV